MPGTPTLPPVLPDYGGACIATVVPALFHRQEPDGPGVGWLPAPAQHASQIVLLVLDGLGWEQLRARRTTAPALSGAVGMERPITSVAPTTTACALTSITTGLTPNLHGLLGYRLALDGEILDALHWTVGSRRARDGRRTVPARQFQPCAPFAGASRPVPVVSRSEFGGTGFTAAHLGDSPLHGYKVLSSLPAEVSRLLRVGEPFVYAYYDGIDRVAHTSGLGELYDAELRAVDRMVADVADQLPAGAALVVTADHGQIDVGPRLELLGREIMDLVSYLSGEGRFRWLHARPGRTGDLLDAVTGRYAQTTWVKTRDEVIDEGLFGGPVGQEFLPRLGDVVLIPQEPIAFIDPADTGESRLVSRHGSLTSDEMLVPLVTFAGHGNI
ncbi:MAG TPA: alkaline phosphatase family protein [Acidimicrobiales bacterium]|nr:alkaline phosphatase family protein [Acidimicrobiales bacterium]